MTQDDSWLTFFFATKIPQNVSQASARENGRSHIFSESYLSRNCPTNNGRIISKSCDLIDLIKKNIFFQAEMQDQLSQLGISSNKVI